MSGAVTQPRLITAADRARFDRVARLCSMDSTAGARVCPPSPADIRDVCLQICFDAVPVTLEVPDNPPASASASPPRPPPAPTDFFALALRECVARVRASSGLPVCRFQRPLDEMDFGQRHCDRRCAAVTGAAPMLTK
jgi:hypothetical protein